MNRKIRFLSAVFGAGALIAFPALARILDGQWAAAETQRYDVRILKKPDRNFDIHPVVGPDGNLIGAVSSPNTRSFLQREGLPQ